ncbi:MAG: nucleotidyltransferase [Planctomycetota bacterium]
MATSSTQRGDLTLVLLAAGIGSRYGGAKQLESFGPGGETIMDYSIFDARRAGFSKVVFVIRHGMEAEFREALGNRIEKQMAVRYVEQRLDALPPGFTPPAERVKPWGTGQALLAAADVVGEPFIAANADDFYGSSAYSVMAEFLSANRSTPKPTYAMVGYRLRDTLSESGTVSRGVCHCDAGGWLTDIVETTNIEQSGDDGRWIDDAGVSHSIPGETLVSMNFWGFQPGFFDVLRAGFSAFIQKNATSAKAEFYLPFAVREAMKSVGARVKVLQSADAWCGVTHRADRANVEKMLRDLVEMGTYPRRLWT